MLHDKIKYAVVCFLMVAHVTNIRNIIKNFKNEEANNNIFIILLLGKYK